MIGYRHTLAQQARARSAEQVDGLALFDFPVRPPAGNEPISLPLDGTIEGRYAAWRSTPEGAHLFDVMRWRALALVRVGESRLSAKGLLEWCRAEHKRHVNNDYTALIGRELVALEPDLVGKIEMRQRGAT